MGKNYVFTSIRKAKQMSWCGWEKVGREADFGGQRYTETLNTSRLILTIVVFRGWDSEFVFLNFLILKNESFQLWDQKEMFSSFFWPSVFLFSLERVFIGVKIVLAIYTMIFLFLFLNEKESFYNRSSAATTRSRQWAQFTFPAGLQRPVQGGPLAPTTNMTTLLLPHTSCEAQRFSVFGNLNEHQKDNQILVKCVPLLQPLILFFLASPPPALRQRVTGLK